MDDPGRSVVVVALGEYLETSLAAGGLVCGDRYRPLELRDLDLRTMAAAASQPSRSSSNPSSKEDAFD
jgi:hypothetical protein